ncbi:MAG TPA: hypothetical protein VKP69_13010, partial [Isosphaeraceae bacterium]|nr:hypothetical protein [Isosphaeraceae bacterium]
RHPVPARESKHFNTPWDLTPLPRSRGKTRRGETVPNRVDRTLSLGHNSRPLEIIGATADRIPGK